MSRERDQATQQGAGRFLSRESGPARPWRAWRWEPRKLDWLPACLVQAPLAVARRVVLGFAVDRASCSSLESGICCSIRGTYKAIRVKMLAQNDVSNRTGFDLTGVYRSSCPIPHSATGKGLSGVLDESVDVLTLSRS